MQGYKEDLLQFTNALSGNDLLPSREEIATLRQHQSQVASVQEKDRVQLKSLADSRIHIVTAIQTLRVNADGTSPEDKDGLWQQVNQWCEVTLNSQNTVDAVPQVLALLQSEAVSARPVTPVVFRPALDISQSSSAHNSQKRHTNLLPDDEVHQSKKKKVGLYAVHASAASQTNAQVKSPSGDGSSQAKDETGGQLGK